VPRRAQAAPRRFTFTSLFFLNAFSDFREKRAGAIRQRNRLAQALLNLGGKGIRPAKGV